MRKAESLMAEPGGNTWGSSRKDSRVALAIILLLTSSPSALRELHQAPGFGL